MQAKRPMMTTVAQSSMARGTFTGSSAAGMSVGRGLAASSWAPGSGAEDMRSGTASAGLAGPPAGRKKSTRDRSGWHPFAAWGLSMKGRLGDSRGMTRIGLVSDTHGLLRPEALDWLRGSDAIVHAGDICDPATLDALAALAPLLAVRGNNDHGPWADTLPLRAGRPAACVQGVVTGHSPQPRIERREGVLYVNPGSAGPRRFRLPVSAAELRIAGGRVEARLHTLPAAPA